MTEKLKLFGLVCVSALAAAAFMATLVLIPGSPRSEGWGGAPVYIPTFTGGDPGSEGVTGGSDFFEYDIDYAPSAKEVCVDEQDLIAWMRGPPNPHPSAEIFMMLRGGHAEVFLQITGGSALATEPRVIYMYHAPRAPNRAIRGSASVALADASGCLIKMNGERTTSISAGFAGQTVTIRTMCNALAVAGSRRWNRCADLTGMPNGLLNGPAKWERPV